ncbi:MAG: NrfD/PsrC family molybdoenzyme membrane anchor subunit [Candidatus Dormibacteraceae bacterium]
MTQVAEASDSYYGRPVLKTPPWKPEVAWYFWIGGMAGVSAALALGARLSGNRRLTRSALVGAVAGAVASPALLIDDLGRPERFLNMLRVFKPTSPMSVGTWVLAGFGAAVTGATVSEFTGLLRPAGRIAALFAGALGPVLSTYTAVLISNTAVPVWHEARRILPFVFAGSSIASAGGLAAVLTPVSSARPARRLAVIGSAVELVAAGLMERELGDWARPYQEGDARHLSRLSRLLTLAGGTAMLLAGRRRWQAASAGTMLLAGALAQRHAVLKAGIESSRQSRGR